MSDKRILLLASEICDLLENLCKQEGTPLNCPPPMSDFPYADALLRWEARGKPSEDFFSTDDKFFLHFREHLMEKYELSILSREEGKLREELKKAILIPVSGFGSC